MMRLALITTTIHIPQVLARYREIDKGVMFFVVGDRKTPHRAVKKFISGLGNAIYYSDTDQEKLGYKVSDLIGWNCIMRRNIALLEAIKYGADIIVTIDDDNFPINKNYFKDFIRILTSPFNGSEVSSKDSWFNIGEYTVPKVYHRGFPFEMRNEKRSYVLNRVQKAKIGIAAGLWCADPDINAIERIVFNPRVKQFKREVRRGLCVKQGVFAPVGTQNTAFISRIAPLFLVLSSIGRYDDIWASYMVETIMYTDGYLIHYGPPFVRQERNQHNLWQNLEDELFGMEYTLRFCQDLRKAKLGNGTMLEKFARLHEYLKNKNYLPPHIYKLAQAWLRDIGKVLKDG